MQTVSKIKSCRSRGAYFMSAQDVKATRGEMSEELESTNELIGILEYRLGQFADHFSTLSRALFEKPELVCIDGASNVPLEHSDETRLFDSESLKLEKVRDLTEQLRGARMKRDDLNNKLNRR
jgi:hypothetical protein